MMPVAVHELGKEAVLLGETAEALSFKLKPAASHPVGRFQDEEFWNTYQGLQQLSRNTDKQPVFVRTMPAQILPFLNTKDLTVASELILPESQSLLAFDEVAMYFSRKSGSYWIRQRAFYNDVMQEN